MWMFALLGPEKFDAAVEAYNSLPARERKKFRQRYEAMLRRTKQRRIKRFDTPGARKILGDSFVDGYIADATEWLAASKKK